MSGETNWIADNFIALAGLLVGLCLSVYNARVAYIKYKQERSDRAAKETSSASVNQLELTFEALRTQNSLLVEERLEYKADIEKLEAALDKLRKIHQVMLRRDSLRERREALLISTIEKSLRVEVPALPVLPELK